MMYKLEDSNICDILYRLGRERVSLLLNSESKSRLSEGEETQIYSGTIEDYHKLPISPGIYHIRNTQMRIFM